MDYNKDRNEFIENFKYQQRSDQSRIITERNKSKEKEPINMNNRWDYLHQLSKVQQMKKRQKQEIFQKENSINEIRECTFSPKVNKSQGIKYDSNNNNFSIIDRQSLWNQKKQTKLEQIKNDQVNKENDECFFQPKINCPNKSRHDIYEDAKNYLVDPESYEIYIEKLKKYRNGKQQELLRHQSAPGSGRRGIISRITKPKEFNLITENRDIKNITNNSKHQQLKRDNKLTEKEMTSLIYSPEKENAKQLEKKAIQGSIRFEKIDFNDAIKILHDQLHSIDLYGYN